MTQAEILYEFEQMSIEEQLEILRAALEIVESAFKRPHGGKDEKLPLADAAKILLADYETDGELTVFIGPNGNALHMLR